MSAHRFRRVDRRTAEQLLDGAPDRARAGGPDALSELLAAASVPAREGEFAGEQAALAAFRAARLADAAQPRRRSMLTVTPARLLTVKTAAAAVAAVTVGGVAVAAVTGSVPTQPGNGGSTAPPMVTVPSTVNHVSETNHLSETLSAVSGTTPAAPDKNATDKTATGKNTGTGKAHGDTNDSGSPSPSPVGLCRAHTAGAGAGAGAEHGKALQNPAFTGLIKSAGGQAKIAAHCAGLLGKQPRKSTHPEGKPNTHPHGPDETHQKGKPNSPPSSRPHR